MKKLLAGAFVAVLCMGVVGSQPVQADAAGRKVCLWHKADVGPPSVLIKVSLAAVPAHLAHGDRRAICIIDIPK